MKNVEWGQEVYLKNLFTIKRGKRLTVENRIDGDRPLVTAGYENTGVAQYIGNSEQEVFPKDTITIDMFANTFYRDYDFSADDNILVLSDINKIPSKAKHFIVSLINNKLQNKFSYGKQYRMGSFNQTKIQLPIKNDKIDFEFMERFVSSMEYEHILKLENYINEIGLSDYQLTEKETQALENYTNVNWSIFNLENLFGKSTRGRRLKSADRVTGTLPFITAGETDEGVSAFIGNDVKVFSANTTTIDMFGSAKYRNFKYGGDDHIAVVHTDKLPKYASVFVTAAIHKSSYNGQFNYGRNFYAKDADALDISLPTKDNNPDYKTMDTIISAIHKLVIKDVVVYVERKKEEINKLTENANADNKKRKSKATQHSV